MGLKLGLDLPAAAVDALLARRILVDRNPDVIQGLVRFGVGARAGVRVRVRARVRLVLISSRACTYCGHI